MIIHEYVGDNDDYSHLRDTIASDNAKYFPQCCSFDYDIDNILANAVLCRQHTINMTLVMMMTIIMIMTMTMTFTDGGSSFVLC